MKVNAVPGDLEGELDRVTTTNSPKVPAWLMKMIFLIAASIGFVFIISRVERDTTFTLAQTRPVAQVATLLLGGVVLWNLVTVGRAITRRRWPIAWRVSLRLTGWVGMVAGFIGVVIFVVQPENSEGLSIGGAERAVEAIIPLAIGVQAAFLLSPDDEPGMEVLLACPRPGSWILLERLASEKHDRDCEPE